MEGAGGGDPGRMPCLRGVTGPLECWTGPGELGADPLHTETMGFLTRSSVLECMLLGGGIAFE